MQVYLDNAATSRCKPEQVLQAIEHFYQEVNCNPGRGGYELSLEAGRKVMEARAELADFFHVEQPNQVIFTPNVTVALNIAIKGLLQPGDHVLISGLEHNAVVRPIHALQQERQISYSVLPVDERGLLDPQAVLQALKHNTKMIVSTHASNLTGSIVPVEEIGKIAREKGLYFIVDAAQTAGCLPLDFQQLHASVLAFTGHKHLLGPMGIGGFCVSRDTAAKMKPLYEGGTGSISDRVEQPDFLPDKFESGTLNTLGVVGLGAAVKYLKTVGLNHIRSKEMALTRRLLEGLKGLPAITIYGPQDAELQTGTIAVNFAEIDNAELCFVLDRQFGIMTRPGLHCAPLAHQSMGTFPEGALRFSIGHYTTAEEIDYAIASLQEILAGMS